MTDCRASGALAEQIVEETLLEHARPVLAALMADVTEAVVAKRETAAATLFSVAGLKPLTWALFPVIGAVVVDFKPCVPGVYTLVDHSLFRIEKGTVRFIHVEGDPMSRPDLYGSASGQEGLKNCDTCKLHP